MLIPKFCSSLLNLKWPRFGNPVVKNMASCDGMRSLFRKESASSRKIASNVYHHRMGKGYNDHIDIKYFLLLLHNHIKSIS